MIVEAENQIEVLACFGSSGLIPRVLKICGRKYEIKEVNLMHSITDGAVRIYFFSVSDETNYWKLGFNTETLRWWVEDSYALAG